jgi:hypothetical protein
MNPLKELPMKHKIKAAILNYLKPFRPGDVLKTDDVIFQCKRYVTRYIREESILRYLRELRQDGKINYTCPVKEDRNIRIIPLGAPHSI